MKYKNRKRLKWILLGIVCAGFTLAVYIAYSIFGPNTASFKEDHKFFYVHTGSIYGDVLRDIQQQGIIRHEKSFDYVARLLHYPDHVLAGKYKIDAGMSNFAIVRLLRSGQQTPVRVVINKERTKSGLAALLDRYLEPDSAAFMALLNNETYLDQYKLDTNTAMCAVIPNTYQFFWNTSAKNAFKRLKKERDKFWTPEREAEADSLGLTPNQVYILASIVEEETNKNSEKPLIASVYLNRLRAGMLLAADPTVKFAVGNFALHRITNKQTSFQSPYNTYQNTGLPPGPICTPSIKTIDAVLNAAESHYYYFCAKADFSGYHVFATNFNDHLKNARAYQKALDSLLTNK